MKMMKLMLKVTLVAFLFTGAIQAHAFVEGEIVGQIDRLGEFDDDALCDRIYSVNEIKEILVEEMDMPEDGRRISSGVSR